MATLQKFKFLATQCAVAGSPTRRPTTSPVIHLRRRKTLRMLLSRGGRLTRRQVCSPDRHRDSTEKGKEMGVSHKLKDLFVSSPPSFERSLSENTRNGLPPAAAGAGDDGSTVKRIGLRSLRSLSATFRQRLLRRAWRPVLVSIPE